MSAAGREGSRYSFLISRRWAGLGALIAGFVALSIVLGFWQWDRFETRLAQARQVEEAFDATPEPLDHVLAGDAAVGTADQWRPVELTGRYLDEADGLDHHTVLLRNRPVDGTAAVHLIALFEADSASGPVLVPVNRGWLADARVDSAEALPAPPAGPASVVVRLRLAEQPRDQERPEGQVYALDPAGLVEAWGAGDATDGATLLWGYGTAVSENPDAGVELGTVDRPAARWGLNLSYAIQWWIFAVGALVALVVLARREAAERAAEHHPDEDGSGGENGPTPPTQRRRRSAEEEEDALIEAQLHG